MRNMILSITTKSGEKFERDKDVPQLKDQTRPDELTVTHMDYIERVDEEGEPFGGYRIFCLEKSPGYLTNQLRAGVLIEISVEEVARVASVVPISDIKAVMDEFMARLQSDVAEGDGDDEEPDDGAPDLKQTAAAPSTEASHGPAEQPAQV